MDQAIPGQEFFHKENPCKVFILVLKQETIQIEKSRYIDINEEIKLPSLTAGSRLCSKAKMLVKRCITSIGKPYTCRVLGVSHKTVDKIDKEISEIPFSMPKCQKANVPDKEDLTFPDGTIAKGRDKRCVRLAKSLSDELQFLIFQTTLEHYTTGTPINIRDFATR